MVELLLAEFLYEHDEALVPQVPARRKIRFLQVVLVEGQSFNTSHRHPVAILQRQTLQILQITQTIKLNALRTALSCQC